MKNVMTINHHTAVIVFDPELEMFRGEFINLNGSADFYASSVQELHREGEVSLSTFLEVCKEQRIEPYKHYSGKFVARISPDLHERITIIAAAEGISLNQWVQKSLEHEAMGV
jgi:predicted HicB family RNase H-like nuclease